MQADAIQVPTLPLRHAGSGALPVLGFGTWQITGTEAYDAVRAALDAGYRHLDTAWMYRNHDQVGRALADSGVPRDDVFLTTKIPPNRAREWRQTLDKSLEDLRTDHVDLWLIHWTEGSSHADLWEHLLEAQRDGQARAVGVSNYDVDQVDDITKATGEAPAVNQVRYGPTIHDSAFLAAMAEREVVVEGYSGLKITDLDDPTLREIADAHGVSTAQVVTRWQTQHDVVAIPKSVTPARIEANLASLRVTLSDDEMARIDALS